MVLLIVAGVLLLVCGGVGFAVYTFVMKVKEKVEQTVERITNPATPERFHSINYTMTRSDVDMTLGSGRQATMDDLNAAFPAGGIALQKWTPKVQAGRVMVWKNANNEDRLFIAFYPNLNSNSHVQMKELAAKTSGNSVSDGYINEDDAAYAKKLGLEAPDATITITAEDLIREYTTSSTAADRKYKGKELWVTDGVLEKWEGDIAVIHAKSGRAGANRIRVQFKPSEKELFSEFKPEDDLDFKGKCEGRTGLNISVKQAIFE